MQRSAHDETDSSINKKDISRYKRIKRLSYLLDNSIRIPGIGYRIGLDAIVGLVPGIGDTLGAAVSAYIIYEASKLGVPKHTQARMVYNVALEYLIGLIPIVGDVFDATWKANVKNIVLLEKYFSRTERKID